MPRGALFPAPSFHRPPRSQIQIQSFVYRLLPFALELAGAPFASGVHPPPLTGEVAPPLPLIQVWITVHRPPAPVGDDVPPLRFLYVISPGTLHIRVGGALVLYHALAAADVTLLRASIRT